MKFNINGKENNIRKVKVREVKTIVSTIGNKITEVLTFMQKENFLSELDGFIVSNFEEFQNIILPFLDNATLEDLDEMDMEDFVTLMFKIMELNGLKKEKVIAFFQKLSPSSEQIQDIQAKGIQFSQKIEE